MSKSIRTLIVDDEPGAREGLKHMFLDDEDIEVVALCSDGIEAVQLLKETRIDLMFLDIHMPGMNGFEVLNNTSKDRWPLTVFITAFDEHAIQAFEYHAVDYLLKPFSDERFVEMLNRVKELIRTKRRSELSEQYEKLKDKFAEVAAPEKQINYFDTPTGDQHLVLRESGKIAMIPLSNIAYIEAWDYYVKVHYGSKYFLKRITIKDLIQRLPSDQFMRVHRSYIVNIDHIDHIDKRETGQWIIVLKEGKKIRISSTYRKELLSILGLT